MYQPTYTIGWNVFLGQFMCKVFLYQNLTVLLLEHSKKGHRVTCKVTIHILLISLESVLIKWKSMQTRSMYLSRLPQFMYAVQYTVEFWACKWGSAFHQKYHQWFLKWHKNMVKIEGRKTHVTIRQWVEPNTLLWYWGNCREPLGLQEKQFQ